MTDFDKPPSDPLPWFQQWLEEAQSAGFREPTAMTLATTDPSGQPSARVVLFKGLHAGLLSFYTNSLSQKGREIGSQAPAALCFWWDKLYRQLRIEGPVQPLPAAAADDYFAGRPRGSQIGAWASTQSAAIDSRSALEAQFTAADQRFQDQPVPRPEAWLGYGLRPQRIEFWQGQANRLHDRRQYQRNADDSWSSRRLQP